MKSRRGETEKGRHGDDGHGEGETRRRGDIQQTRSFFLASWLVHCVDLLRVDSVPVSPLLRVSVSVITASPCLPIPVSAFPFVLHPFELVELRGIEPLRPACKAGIMAVRS